MSIVFVPLTGVDASATIDAEDADRVEEHSWKLMAFHGKPVPVARIDGKYVRLNRFVMGCSPGDGFWIVPKNDDFLDCRKENLVRFQTDTDPTKSWDKRNKTRKQVRRPVPKPVIPGLSDCAHPLVSSTPIPSVYLCAICGYPCTVTPIPPEDPSLHGVYKSLELLD